jgi:hypothetical protein
LTPQQLEVFLQSEFKRLAQEAGVKGVRVHVERATAADYEQVLRDVTRVCPLRRHEPHDSGATLLSGCPNELHCGYTNYRTFHSSAAPHSYPL